MDKENWHRFDGHDASLVHEIHIFCQHLHHEDVKLIDSLQIEYNIIKLMVINKYYEKERGRKKYFKTDVIK